MHQELVDILVAEDVSAKSIDVIAGKKILTIKAFPNVVTGKDQLGVLLRGTPQEDIMPDIAGMRQASARSRRPLSPAGEASSSSVDDLDQPLPLATQLELERVFFRKFSWRKLPLV